MQDVSGLGLLRANKPTIYGHRLPVEYDITINSLEHDMEVTS